jgi:hypothetical protein
MQSKINLNNLKAAISFKDGMVSVKPFDINYKDIKDYRGNMV